MSIPTVTQDKTVQQLSIHQLNLGKICERFNVKEDEFDSLDVIDKVVNQYNGSAEKEKQNLYLKILSKQDELPNHFQLVVYAQFNDSVSRLANWIQSQSKDVLPLDLQTRHVNYIFFFYRRKEIFVLTSGQAWLVVQKFTDYSFPHKIVRRLFDPNVLSSKNRPLVGSVLIYSEILKASAAVSAAEAVDKLFTQIKFKFRMDASIFRIPIFQNKKGAPPVCGLTAEIGSGRIRIGKDIPIQNWTEILDLFATISQGETTYCFDGGEETEISRKEERDSEEFDFLDYLRPADSYLVSHLERALVEAIYETVINGVPFPPLDFCHKQRSDYFHGTNHKICYRRQSWDCPNFLSAPSMVEQLKEIQALKADDKDAFMKELTKVKVSYVSRGKSKKTPFTQFFEGDFHWNGLPYWRLHTMWYEIQADYLGIIHQEFAKMLDKILLGPNEPASLKHRWPCPLEKQVAKTSLSRYDVEAKYNESFLEDKDYFLGDKICPLGVELFDILHFTQQKLYLYHVKEQFGQKTRDACSQILNSATLIHTLKHQASSNIVQHFCKMATDYSGDEEYFIRVKEKLLKFGEEKFRNLFEKKTIVFVYAFADISTKPRFLSEEKGLRRPIKATDIEKCNKMFKKSGEEIYKALVKEKYITSKGYITSKFLASTKNNFACEILEVDNQRDSLKQMLTKFSSQFNSTIAKLELLGLYRKLENFGFELKICQIYRNDYVEGEVPEGSLKRKLESCGND